MAERTALPRKPKLKATMSYTPHLINYLLLAGGLIGVWHVSHSWVALVFAFIASLHFELRLRPTTRADADKMAREWIDGFAFADHAAQNP